MLQQPSSSVPHWTSRQTRRSLALLIVAGVVVGILFVIAIVADRARVANLAQTRDLARFGTVLRETHGLLRSMQSSARGYLLTGDEGLLDAFAWGERELPGLWTEVQTLAPRVSADATARVRGLFTISDEWRAVVTPLVE